MSCSRDWKKRSRSKTLINSNGKQRQSWAAGFKTSFSKIMHHEQFWQQNSLQGPAPFLPPKRYKIPSDDINPWKYRDGGDGPLTESDNFSQDILDAVGSSTKRSLRPPSEQKRTQACNEAMVCLWIVPNSCGLAFQASAGYFYWVRDWEMM
jgi:hypothetical protein